MAKIRISELPYLASASAGAVLPVVDNGVTYKTDLQVLETAMIHVLSASLDNRLDFLESFSSSFPQFSSSIDIKIAAATNEQSLGHLTTTSSFNTFTSSYINDSASFDDRIKSGNVAAGTISSSAQISALGFITGVVDIDNYVTTASYNLDSASFNTRIENATNEQYLAGFATTQSVNDLSTSIDSRFDTLESFSSSADTRYVLSGSITQTTWDNISGKPNNLVSSSTQITEYGFISESVDISSLNSFTQSAEQRISDLEAATASYLTSLDGAISNSAQVDYNYILNTPNNIISSSTQISELGFVTGAYVTINEYNSLTQSFNQITESYYTLSGSFGSVDFSGINAITESYLLFTQSYYSASASVDTRLIALETAVDNDGMFLTTSSFEAYTQSIDNRVSGLEAQTSSYLTSLDGAITSSQQIADLGFITGVVDIDNYVTTASYNLDSASFSIRILAATNEQFLGGFATTGSNIFTGNQTISASLYVSGTTELGGNIIPATPRGATLGTSERPFADIFIQSASIHIQSDISGAIDTTLSNVNGNIQISAGGMQLLGSGSFNAASASLNYISGNVYFDILQNTLQNFSSSLDSRIVAATNEQNLSGFATTSSLEIISASAWGAFTSASSYSGSFYSTINNLSESIYQTDATQSNNTTNISSSLYAFSQSIDNRINAINVGSASVPTGTISSSAQISALGFITSSGVDNDSMYATTSSLSDLSASIYLTDSTQSNNIVINSASAWGAYTSASAYSASAAATYAIKGGDATFNNLTATTFILSSSVYYVTASYSSGSTIFGNSSDDTHQFTGSVSISGSLTASLSNGYFWVGNSSNKTYEVPTSSFTTTASFNSFTSSYYIDSASSATARNTTSASLASLQLSLGTTSVPFSASSVVNPSSYVLVTYYTASYNGGTMDLIAVDTVNNKATSTNYQFVNAGSGTGIAQNGKASSGAGAPNPALSADIVSGSVRLKVSDTGTFLFKGVIRLF